MSDATQQAHKAALEIESAFGNGNTQDTWNKLKNDIESHKTGSQSDTEYSKALADELTKRG